MSSMFNGGLNLIGKAVVYGFGVALLISNVYVVTQLAHVNGELAAVRSDLDATKLELSNVRERSVNSSRAAGRTISQLEKDLAAAKKAADSAVGEAKENANHHVQQLAAELSKRLASEQQRRENLQQQMKSEVSEAVAAASQAQAKVGEVKTEVVQVRSELEANRARLERTVADLRRVKGDLGVQSGLIATNQRELAALKALGEKNYFDIDLAQKESRSLAGVTLTLKKADLKKLRFTLDVIANDKRVEKKDRHINEPVQFLVNKSKGPYSLQVDELYELVINEITKDHVRGYLSTPKSGPAHETSIATR